MIYEEKESYAASRSHGLGGTDVAAILGLSPWKDPISVWQGKVNPGSMPELDKECLFWGSALEPIVRDRYALRHDVFVVAPSRLDDHFKETRPWNDAKIIVGDEPWMLAAPDGWMPKYSAGLEIKCSARKSAEWGEEGSEEIPAHYYTQAAWYMAVCKATGWNFGVLFSGNTLQQYRIERDPAFELDMMNVARAFWHDYVVPEIEPPIDQTTSYGSYLAQKYSLGNENVITEPGPDILEWTAKLKLAEDMVKEAEEKKHLANNHLRDLVGDAKSAKTPLGTIGWVRPKERQVVDLKGFFEAVGPQHPAEVAALTFPRHDAPYLRAWWRK